jgi:hypothetical protein
MRVLRNMGSLLGFERDAFLASSAPSVGSQSSKVHAAKDEDCREIF